MPWCTSHRHFVEKTLAVEDDSSAPAEEELPLELRILASAAAQPPLKRARVDAVTATPVGGAALVPVVEEYWRINSTRSAAYLPILQRAHTLTHTRPHRARSTRRHCWGNMALGAPHAPEGGLTAAMQPARPVPDGDAPSARDRLRAEGGQHQPDLSANRRGARRYTHTHTHTHTDR